MSYIPNFTDSSNPEFGSHSNFSDQFARLGLGSILGKGAIPMADATSRNLEKRKGRGI